MSEIKVTYLHHAGDDLTPVNAARISFASESTGMTEKDEKLLDYLAKNKHFSPFEHCSLSVLVECPLYIRSQIHRHRTFAYNEVSRRYTDEGLEFYLPPVDDIRSQSKSNKQASDGPLDETVAQLVHRKMSQQCRESEMLFEELIFLGVSREQARGILPQCLMTKFYMTGNLRNWVHFLQLRIHAHAQKEAQYVGLQAKAILEQHFPKSSAALFKYEG